MANQQLVIAAVILFLLCISSSVAAAMSTSNTVSTSTSNTVSTSTVKSSPAPSGTTTSGGGAVSSGSSTAPVTSPVDRSNTTIDNTSCYSPSADLGFQGKISVDDAKNRCNADTNCRAFTRHEAGDVWLLRDAATKNTRNGATCWIK